MARNATRAPLWTATLAALLTAANLTAGPAYVQVDRIPPVERVRLYDPLHPPPEMPYLPRGWGGATLCYYSVSPRLSVADRFEQAPGVCTARAEVTGITIVLELTAESWVPTHAALRVFEHEEGHRRICLRAYEDAETAGREAGREILGRSFEAHAAACAEASQIAVEIKAVSQLRQSYDRLTRAARRIGEYYDLIGQHGANLAPPTIFALQGALARYDEELARHWQPADTRCDSPESDLDADAWRSVLHEPLWRLYR